MKAKCPYCNRKIPYMTLMLERGYAEHVCIHCKKRSNIFQNKKLWNAFFAVVSAALVIMIFYFAASGPIQKAHDETGGLGFFTTLFFGSGKEIKWIIWEIIPFIVFFFISPRYMEFAPQKRYLGQTGSIDLSTVEKIPPKGAVVPRADGSTRIIPKADSSPDEMIFEEISSTSLEKTRSFSVADSTGNTDKSGNTAAHSSSHTAASGTPLKKVRHVQPADTSATEPDTEPKPPAPQNSDAGRYSANRRF